MDMCMKILSSSSSITEAPEYIRVLPFGYVSSENGDFIVDHESFVMMKNHMLNRRIDIVIDYEHQTLKGIQAPAGGWIKEIIERQDGIYAKVEWTGNAKRYIQCKEYRYLSPVILCRKKDKKAVQLHSAALTNTPAINDMTPIVNSSNINGYKSHPLTDLQKQICRMTNVREDEFLDYMTHNTGR